MHLLWERRPWEDSKINKSFLTEYFDLKWPDFRPIVCDSVM